VPIGTRAGAPRPSTGYAFLPIQRHGARIAAAVARGQSPSVPMRGAATTWLDGVFLRRLLADPAGAPDLFLRLFRRVPADRLVRFLSETGTPADVLAAVAALPAGPMLRAACWPRYGLGSRGAAPPAEPEAG
jgi:lycopene beta-cyclase